MTTEPRSSDRLRFAVLCRGELAAWQSACVHALTASQAAEVAMVIEAGPDLCLGSNPDLRDLDFILAFAPAFETAACPVWEVRFAGAASGMDVERPVRGLMYHRTTIPIEVVEHRVGSPSKRVLHHARIPTQPTLRGTLVAARHGAAAVCAGALQRVRSDALPVNNTPFVCPPLRISDARLFMEGAVRLAGRAVRRLFLRELWTVGFARITPQRIVHGDPIPTPRWMQAASYGRFSADPFSVEVDGRTHVLFETWSTVSGRGWIATLPIDEKDGFGPGAGETAIDLKFHASYPAVFAYKGDIFCAPEMWEGGGLRIFRRGETPTDWHLAAHILEPVPIVDPTFVVHDGRWWLFATIRGQAPDAELHAWFATNPVGPWTSHPHNPIKTDLGSARPGGAFFRDGATLYRPAQDCSAGYGTAVVLNRVIRLDPQGFEEVEVTRILPDANWPSSAGIHTINACLDGVLIDAKRQIFDPLAAFWTLLPHLRRLIRRPG